MSSRPRNRVKTKKEKGLHQILQSFCHRSLVKTKKTKKCSPRIGTKFGRYLWDLFVLADPFSSDLFIRAIYDLFIYLITRDYLWDLFVLAGLFSSDQPALKSRWGR